MIETTPCVYDFYNTKKGSQLQSQKFIDWDEERNREPESVVEDPAYLGGPQLDPCENDAESPPPPPPAPPVDNQGPDQPPPELTPIQKYRRCKNSDPGEDSIAYLFFLKEFYPVYI